MLFFFAVLSMAVSPLTGINHNTKAYNNLNGPLTWELTKLQYLTGLSMVGNLLSGSIPSGFGRLVDIQVSRNKLEGPIPSELFGGHDTTKESLFLSLSYNQLTGTIPTEIGLSQWKGVLLGHNRLSGSLPMELWDATSLVLCDVSGNKQVCIMIALIEGSKCASTLANLPYFPLPAGWIAANSCLQVRCHDLTYSARY